MTDKRVVGIDDVLTALRIREAGGSWSDVIEATGFNGATLRPKINRYLAREVLGRATTEKGDRVDSPYAVSIPVELSTESIDRVRAAGMAWYSIAEALGVSEAKVKGLASPEAKGRVYVGRKPEPTPEPTEEEVAEAKRVAKNAAAKARRAAKKAAAAA